MANNQLDGFRDLENAIHELVYHCDLWSKMEQETKVAAMPGGKSASVYADRQDVEIHSFLGSEINRRATALRLAFLSCYELPIEGRSND